MADLYVCTICGSESFHPDDVRTGYCGTCHAFTRSCALMACAGPGAVVLGNIAVCVDHAAELEATLEHELPRDRAVYRAPTTR